MANPVAPFGFKPIRRVDGAAWSGNLTQRKIKSDNAGVFCKGDVVKQLNTGYIDIGAAGITDHSNVGIFYGCHYLSTVLGYPIWSNRFPGSGNTGDVDAFIIDDPLVVFEVMAGTGPVTFANIGETADYTVATGNTSSGISAWTLTNPAGSATAPFRVIGFPATGVIPGSDIASINNLVEVMWNDMLYRQQVSL